MTFGGVFSIIPSQPFNWRETDSPLSKLRVLSLVPSYLLSEFSLFFFAVNLLFKLSLFFPTRIIYCLNYHSVPLSLFIVLFQTRLGNFLLAEVYREKNQFLGSDDDHTMTTDRHSGFRRSGFGRSGLDVRGLDVRG